ncbi:low specificity L-threonine aldolase [Geomicrobium sp. JCM 19039]|uniref:threonine aldolase family protein n=1 Tax=Geomicrobium sp. JCM 19039 TaxID=1460636 RepID=UPI00045F17F0|nr:GntG family PLP-dependent aldolase [Geomicrobium sp. JCM 19039]GAK10606.1 low-specificity L-threonine aldolase [Geomicrobium sp. JCM 19039]
MIDLRSDTVTKPTEAMRAAMVDAVVGDDVYEDDPTVNDLEEYAAELLGKEAALFVSSGTQGNQIAVLAHCQPGNEVIMEAESHIFHYEGAAIAAFAGVQPHTVYGVRGVMDAADVEEAIRPDDIHAPETGLICMENTHNRHGGTIITPEEMRKVTDLGRRYQIPTHLDGARLFHASVALGEPIKNFTKSFTTVQVCLSKGLGAPVGSIIAGDQTFIKSARKWRKRLGGGMRQAGVIAAPGKIALTDMIELLENDHTNAKRLAEGIGNIPGMGIHTPVETNIILVETDGLQCTEKEFSHRLYSEGVLANPYRKNIIRLVTHKDVTSTQIEATITAVQRVVKDTIHDERKG